MMHKTWSSIEEVSYCFQGHPSNFKVTRDKKIADFDHNRAFPGCNSSLNSPMALKWCTKLNVVFKRCPIVFHRHPSNFKVTGDKKIADFDPNWAFPDRNSSLNSMMAMEWFTKAWSSIEEIPYCFSRSLVKFRGHTRQKIANIDRIKRYRTVTAVWIHQWIWNGAPSST